MKKIFLVMFLLSSSVSFAFYNYSPHKVNFLPPEYSVPRKVKCNNKTYDIIVKSEFSMLSDEEICRMNAATFKLIDDARKRYIKDIILAVVIYIYFGGLLLWLIKYR